MEPDIARRASRLRAPATWTLLVLAGCGRIGFPSLDRPDDAGGTPDARPADDAGTDAGPGIVERDAGATDGGSTVLGDELVAGTEFTCARGSDGALYCWGANEVGQLGNGSLIASARPIRVAAEEALSNVTATGNGEIDTPVGRSACATDPGGALYCWGQNDFGLIGPGTAPITSPQRHPFFGRVQHVTVGGAHVCATQDGTAYCWGQNDRGQLGDGSMIARSTPAPPTLAEPTRTICAGWSHTCALGAGVVCWGANDWGQAGGVEPTALRPTAVLGLTDPIAIACQESSTCALEASGVVRCWGRGDLGQLGDGLGRQSGTPVAVAGIDDARGVYGGHSNACAIRTDASLWCWGTDQRGEIGNGGLTGDVFVPQLVLLDVAFVSIGAHHMCARKLDRSIACWGTNTQGQLTDAAGAIADTPFTLTIP